MDIPIKFFRLIPDARHPAVADTSAAGALFTKATRHCEAIRAASGYGWYVFPAHDLTVEWNGGTEIKWWFDGEYGGILNGNHVDAVQYPDFFDLFNSIAPKDCQDFSPPWFSALQEQGYMQIWSGWMVQTPQDWSVEVRSIVNRPPPNGFEVKEGIIESDRWFGPLFTNIRLTKIKEPILISTKEPLFQLRPIHRAIYQGKPVCETYLLDAKDAADMWSADDWGKYFETVVKPHEFGQYAVTSRQRTRVHFPPSE